MENDSLWEMLFFISIVGLAHLSSLTIEVIFISKMFPTRLEEAKLVIGDHPSQCLSRPELQLKTIPVPTTKLKVKIFRTIKNILNTTRLTGRERGGKRLIKLHNRLVFSLKTPWKTRTTLTMQYINNEFSRLILTVENPVIFHYTFVSHHGNCFFNVRRKILKRGWKQLRRGR